mmetsp:Transcript_36840/g.98667  ORF Transcript_36840/g.98667 Transcript_36840/m.98667 type:complete len:442 (+) Transcript_36840:101-1426(+)
MCATSSGACGMLGQRAAKGNVGFAVPPASRRRRLGGHGRSRARARRSSLALLDLASDQLPEALGGQAVLAEALELRVQLLPPLVKLRGGDLRPVVQDDDGIPQGLEILIGGLLAARLLALPRHYGNREEQQGLLQPGGLHATAARHKQELVEPQLGPEVLRGVRLVLDASLHGWVGVDPMRQLLTGRDLVVQLRVEPTPRGQGHPGLVLDAGGSNRRLRERVEGPHVLRVQANRGRAKALLRDVERLVPDAAREELVQLLDGLALDRFFAFGALFVFGNLALLVELAEWQIARDVEHTLRLLTLEVLLEGLDEKVDHIWAGGRVNGLGILLEVVQRRILEMADARSLPVEPLDEAGLVQREPRVRILLEEADQARLGSTLGHLLRVDALRPQHGLDPALDHGAPVDPGGREDAGACHLHAVGGRKNSKEQSAPHGTYERHG